MFYSLLCFFEAEYETNIFKRKIMQGTCKQLFKAPFTIGARPLYNTLRSKYFSFARPVAYVARSLAFVASVLVVASSRIRIFDMHNIQMRPNAIKIIAMQRTTVRTNVVQRFVCSHEWCTIFKGRKTSRSCLCVCCATMRLLLNMLHVIVQRFTIIARFISFHIESFRPISYKCYLNKEDFSLLLCESYQINVINF